MESDLAMTLSEAMATEPGWLRTWIRVLIGIHLASVLFIVGRDAIGNAAPRWRIRLEPIAILISFFAAAWMMGQLHEGFGYVRLLGLAHLVCWGPVFAWILYRREEFPIRSLFGGYLHLYLLIAGLSLAIDALDVVRYFSGDGELLGRWAGR